MKVRLINSNEPVTSFYRDVVPDLLNAGAEVELIVTKAEYRAGRNLESALPDSPNLRIIHTASPFIKSYAHSKAAKGFARGMYAVQTLVRLLFMRGGYHNVFLTQPPFFHSFGPLIHKLRSHSYSCVVMDVQPQQYAAFGVINESSRAYRTLYKLSAAGYRGADQVIVIGRCMAERLREMGVDDSAIRLVPNWADETTLKAIAPLDNPLRDDRGWQDNFVVTYGGNVGYAQDLDALLDASKLIESPKVKIAVIGGGTRFQELERRVKSENLTNVEMVPFLHEQYSLDQIYGAGDLNFISLRHSCTGLGVPSKAYNSLAAGRPILFHGDPSAEIALMIEEEAIGAVANDAQAIADIINDYAQNPERASSQGAIARSLAEGKYSKSVALERYRDVLLA